MGFSKIFKIILAVTALAAFQGDQVAHAVNAHQPANAHIHATPEQASLPSFAATNFARLNFEALGHPCEDLGHSEADCPLANVVDSFDITNVSACLPTVWRKSSTRRKTLLFRMKLT